MSKFKNDSGYRHEPGYGRIVDGKIYIGIVKNNVDAMKMGRLEVWIPEMGGISTDPSSWYIVSYASPFAGSTNVNSNIEDSQTMGGSQQSYGWWAIPPDLENQVLCCFVNGEAAKGFWFACLWQQNMNHMVPGVASNTSYQAGDQGILPPVVEYNKAQSSVSNLDPNSPRRPRFDPLHNGLTNQGLYTDFERGPSDSSARRESPSKSFGLLTPRANQMYIDDDPNNEFIRLRTRSGVQVLIHDTNGYVYINSGNGNSWMEISDLGIDVYTKNSLSIRTELDLNIRSDRDVNIDAGRNVNIKAGENIKVQAGLGIDVTSGKNTLFTAGADLHLRSSSGMALMGQKIDMKAEGAMKMSASNHSTKASAISRDGMIKDNGGASTNASDAQEATAPELLTQVDYKGSTKNTLVSRMPHHEPWAGHPKVKDQEMPRGDLHKIPARGTGTEAKPLRNEPLTTFTPSKRQRSGDGTVASVPYDVTALGNVQVGTKKVPTMVESAIAKAASQTGIPYGYMMSMAEQESGFNPNAAASTSSATGLYQFTDGTWQYMIKKYPEYGFTTADKNNPEAQAIMAGMYAKENKAVVERATGRPATNTELYMGHFLGGGGASRFLKADPNAPAFSAADPRSVSSNKNVFYVKGNLDQPRTVAEMQAFLASKIEPKAKAYENAQPPRG